MQDIWYMVPPKGLRPTGWDYCFNNTKCKVGIKKDMKSQPLASIHTRAAVHPWEHANTHACCNINSPKTTTTTNKNKLPVSRWNPKIMPLLGESLLYPTPLSQFISSLVLRASRKRAGDLSAHHKAAKQAVKVHRHRSKCYFSAVK